MARLVGFVGNRSDLGARSLLLEKETLRMRPTSGVTSSGVGFYQGGELLLKRRPTDDRKGLSVADLAADLKAEVLIAHIRTATVGRLSAENTHPFRYRQWFYAQTGTAPLPPGDDGAAWFRGRILESLPTFLARDVRGETDAELVFYVFLSFLHDAGKLSRTDISPDEALAALRSTLSLVEQVTSERSKEPLRLNLMLGNPEYLVAYRGGKAMGYQTWTGRNAMERLYAGESFSRTKIPHLLSAQVSVCASDFEDDALPPSFTPLGVGDAVVLFRSAPPVLGRAPSA